jgi:hypothetical protein
MIHVDEQGVEIRTGGGGHLGRWTASQCHFERKGPAAYHFRAEGETMTVRVPDDSGFRAALELIRTERIQMVPRPLAIAGAAATVAAIAIGVLTAGDGPSIAEVSNLPISEVVAATTPPTTGTLPTVHATQSEAPTAEVIVGRWNQLAAGTLLALAGPGEQILSGYLSIEVTDTSIVVTASPSEDAVVSELVVMSLGLTVAAADPTLSPAERAQVVRTLGIDIDGANAPPISGATSRNGVAYDLDFESADRLVLSAGF